MAAKAGVVAIDYYGIGRRGIAGGDEDTCGTAFEPGISDIDRCWTVRSVPKLKRAIEDGMRPIVVNGTDVEVHDVLV